MGITRAYVSRECNTEESPLRHKEHVFGRDDGYWGWNGVGCCLTDMMLAMLLRLGRWRCNLGAMNRRDVLGALAALAAVGAVGAEAQTAPAGAEDLTVSHVFRFSEMEERPSANGGWSRAVTHGTLATGEIVEVHETMLPPGQMPHPPHRHPNSEFILIREGKLQHLNEGVADARPVLPGDIIFNASNRLHGLKNIGTVDATYFVVSVSKPLGA